MLMPGTTSTRIFSLLDAELSARSTWLPNIVSLDFVYDPAESGPYQSQSPGQIRIPNAGPYALTSALKNQVYLEHEFRLCDILDMLESMEATDVKENMEDLVLQELIRINRLKEIEWSSQRNKRGVRGAMVNTGMSFSLGAAVINSLPLEIYFVARHPKNVTLLAIYVTTLAMYILFHVPRRGAAVLLAGMKGILKTQASLCSLANAVPMDPRRLLTIYNLDPVTRSYVCCPSCHFLYDYSLTETRKRKAPVCRSIDDAPLVVSVPTCCTHRRVRTGPICGEPLFHTVIANGKEYSVPLYKYEVQDLKQWVGRLLSRPTIEEHVFNAFRRPRKEYMEDMWDAGHLCKILLKKGERFLPGPADEMRLVFSFSMDSFNPYHMKEAKQTVSSTAIWLILLNLPSYLRYRPENMFLAGIIPGPRKPSLSDVNHSLKLLVDVLLELFDPGVLYSRTARHTQGCRVRAILVPVVSDMLAARQAGGFASATATHFCTRCGLNVQNIENLDRHTWPQRDVAEHIEVAKRWRNAESLDEQEDLFRTYGIRWSPLLDLPYWNPILFTAIEPMHLFDVGLFQSHCRQVWGIDASTLSGDGAVSSTAKAIPRPSNSELEKCYEIIRGNPNPERLLEQLSGKDCARDTLWHICNDHDLRRAGNKRQLAVTIADWVSIVCASERDEELNVRYSVKLHHLT
jgi:Transposase family tnp2